MFMASLVYRRHGRGQAASIIHLAPVVGAGYVSRKASKTAQKWQEKSSTQQIRQRDVHVAFAEALLVGRSGSGMSPEIIVGERKFQPEPGLRVQWFDNLKFSYYATQLLQQVKQTVAVKKEVVSVQTMLRDATSDQEVYTILKGAFGTYNMNQVLILTRR